MAYVDKLAPSMRALVYEFGLIIVADMIHDGGYRDAAALRPVLEQWRSRRQDKWLSTDYVTPKTGSSMRRIYERALGDGN